MSRPARRPRAVAFACLLVVVALASRARATDAALEAATLGGIRVSTGAEQTAVFLDFDRPAPYLDQLRPAADGTAVELQVYGSAIGAGVAARTTPRDPRVRSITVERAVSSDAHGGFVVRVDAAAQVVTRVTSLTSPFRILVLVVDASAGAPLSTQVTVPAMAPASGDGSTTAAAAQAGGATTSGEAQVTSGAAPEKKKRRRSKISADSYDQEALGGDVEEDVVDEESGDVESSQRAPRKPGGGGAGNVQLNADRVVQDRQFDEFIAEGSVHAVYGDVEVRADRVVYRAGSSEIQADGNVWVISPTGTLRGASVNLSLETLTGVIFDGRFTSADGDVRFEGAKIEKTGELTYHVEDARLTSCACDPPDWSFTGSDVDLTLGGYARGASTTFRLWDIPAIWSPYLVLPIKSDRETGFLFPRVGYSNRRGFQIEQPFFWAIDRNMDATLMLETSTNERVGGAVEFRYIRTLSSAGEIAARYFQEKEPEAATDAEGNPLEVDRQRYAIEAFHDEIFAPGVRGKVIVDLLSDTQVNRDTTDDPTLRSQRFTQSKATLTSSWRRWSLLGAVRWYEDLETDANNELQDLPEVTLRGIRQPIPGTPMLLDMRSDATDFYRREGADGLRWDTTPRFYLPIEISHFNLEPSIEPRATFYYADATLTDTETDPVTGETTKVTSLERTSAARLLPHVNVTLDTTISRVFRGDSTDPLETRWKHELDPYVEYDWIPEVDQTPLPSFDRVDRIAQKSLLTYGVEQTLFSRTGRQGSIDNVVTLTFEHSFDLLQEACENGVCPVHGEVSLWPVKGVQLGGYTDWDPETQEFADYTLRAALGDPRGDRLSTRYRFVNGRIEDVNAGARVVLWQGTALYASTRFDQLNSQFLENRGGLHFTAPCDCWGFDLWVIDRTNPEETKFGVQFNFEGLGSAGQAPWWAQKTDHRTSLITNGP
ncbi:MAG: LPS-assembly protein LptD [Deltaproteobacteria bacterium]|nr:LPS-assembly protein LptD [Deltaproteobacteria bacterium]